MSCDWWRAVLVLSSDWCRDGLMIPGTDNQWLVVRLLSVEGKFVKAHEFGQQVWSHFIFNPFNSVSN